MNDLNTQPGDLVQLVSPTNKVFTFRLIPGGQYHTHRGMLNHDDLIGKPWGSRVLSHIESAFYLLQPSLSSLLEETKRNTQIMYPKDIGYVLIMMAIGPGARVVEAGTGSGALTTALAWAVGPTGQIFTYENRPEMQNLARKNLQRLGLDSNVIFKLKDIGDGFDETGMDALFLDVANPHDYIHHARKALKPGGFFGCILPTTNQVSHLLPALHQNHFAFVDVCEILLRFYKPVPQRLRPTDRMVAHTGYLVFARPLIETDPLPNGDLITETDSE